MQVTMDRLSHEVTVGGIDPDSTVEIVFGKDKLKGKVNKEGIAIIDCKKHISKNLRKEMTVIVKGKENEEYIFEVRQTKLIPLRVVEVRKEK